MTVSPQLAVRRGDRGAADPERGCQLPLGGQAYAESQLPVDEQATHGAGQHPVLRTAVGSPYLPRREQPAQLGPSNDR